MPSVQDIAAEMAHLKGRRVAGGTGIQMHMMYDQYMQLRKERKELEAAKKERKNSKRPKSCRQQPQRPPATSTLRTKNVSPFPEYLMLWVWRKMELVEMNLSVVAMT
jgi:hypothetical protein